MTKQGKIKPYFISLTSKLFYPMKKLIFVDSSFRELPFSAPIEQRYAVDLGVRDMLAGDKLPARGLHFFVSAVPWKKNVDRDEIQVFTSKFAALNPEVKFGLLSENQIDCLNSLSEQSGFKITNCATSECPKAVQKTIWSNSLESSRAVAKWWKSKADVYVVFGYPAGQEKQCILPDSP